ncbi:MAG: tRNA (adenosine(37)-N6)-dimethylallyltransferase MiaA [Crocinitomicaceae bacterium]|nr:tRNA (adenosine(37)-N6)-dimethylallyltransferase MiaA [Crocinitomicaceae bacterium]
MSKLIIIQGPTASGKSSLSLEIAVKLGAPIISADSRQFYKELSIGTAKPSKKEQEMVSHYFVDSHSIHDLTITSAEFMKLGRQKISELFNEGQDYIVVTGGSGMFIDALINGLHPSPSNASVRSDINEEWKSKGIEKLIEELKKKDSTTYERIDLNNPMRVLRALEVIRVSGKTLGEIRKQEKIKIDYPYLRFGISWERQDLYERIDRRVNEMIGDGLLEEVKGLPLKENLLIQNTVGYKEWIPYFENGMSFEDTVAMIQKNSRNYGKRQETWMKRYSDLIVLSPYESSTMLDQLIKHI